jgi:hypothetical protein
VFESRIDQYQESVRVEALKKGVKLRGRLKWSK